VQWGNCGFILWWFSLSFSCGTFKLREQVTPSLLPFLFSVDHDQARLFLIILRFRSLCVALRKERRAKVHGVGLPQRFWFWLCPQASAQVEMGVDFIVRGSLVVASKVFQAVKLFIWHLTKRFRFLESLPLAKIFNRNL